MHICARADGGFSESKEVVYYHLLAYKERKHHFYFSLSSTKQ